jgi:hypothetical protein
MWLMAVPAFYYQVRIALGLANVVEPATREWLRVAMTKDAEFGKQLPPTFHPTARLWRSDSPPHPG